MFKKIIEWLSRKGVKSKFKFECSECDWSKTEKLRGYGIFEWDDMFDSVKNSHWRDTRIGDDLCTGHIQITEAQISYDGKLLELEDGSALGFCVDCFWVKLLVINEGIDVYSLYKLLEREMKLSHNKLGGRMCDHSARKLLIRLHQE
jgi:hypothetical protein